MTLVAPASAEMSPLKGKRLAGQTCLFKGTPKSYGRVTALPKCVGLGFHVTGLPASNGIVLPKFLGIVTACPKLTGVMTGTPCRKLVPEVFKSVRSRPRGINIPFLSYDVTIRDINSERSVSGCPVRTCGPTRTQRRVLPDRNSRANNIR